MTEPPDRESGSRPPGSRPTHDEAPTIDTSTYAGTRTRIGRYTVRRVIASGGMGTVLEAIQDEPRRTVALKIMKGGIATPDALRRFQFEAQLLARLRHPAIAQIYEAGTHDDGSGAVPYFAMEYIPNAKSITEHSAARRLNLEDRLRLFARICDGIHHGHQKGIVHRDIKPGNLLVDSNGDPHIIDFGVARAADSDAALPAHQTEYGQLVGSLAYMSPEQFEADPNDLDMRSDVYALGVVLYELVAGRLPYEILGAKVYDASRIVRETPPTPLRQVAPGTPVEVETIVMKALEKDRERRYQSAHELAEDLRRFVSGQPILAVPPSRADQIRSFARRNKVLLAGVSTVFAVLVAGVVVSASMYFRAERMRDRAEREAQRAEAAVTFLTGTLESVDPQSFDHEPTIVDLLEAMDRNIEGAFPDDPLAEASVRKSIAWGWGISGNWTAIENHLAKAIELRKQAGVWGDEESIELLNGLGAIYDVTGQGQKRLQIYRELVAVAEKVDGENSENTLNARYRLADVLCQSGQLAEAWEVAQQTAKGRATLSGTESDEYLASQAQLAWIALARGDYADSEARNRQLLETCRSLRGDSHRLSRQTKSQLAATFIAQGELAAAADLYGHRPVLRDLPVEKTYQGSVAAAHKSAEMLVFWETWCPYSQRTVPRLEQMHLRYQNLGLLGMTRTRPPSDDEKVLQFIKDKQLTFPMIKVNNVPGAYYDVQGTPWIVLAYGDEVVWENYMETPEDLLDVIFEGLSRGATDRARS